MRRTLVLWLALGSLGCGAMRPLTAAPSDFRDYEELALVPHKDTGRRLSVSLSYLARHPDGAYAKDVRDRFDTEEASYFERAKDDRRIAIDYLAWLPEGPHAQQLVAVVTAFDAKVEEREERAARLTEQELSQASAEREEAKDWITGAIAAEVSDVGRALDSKLPIVRLLGSADRTWGELRTRRERDLPYSIPVQLGRQPRAVQSRLEVRLSDRVVVEARLSGPSLLVRWAELDGLKGLDETSPAAREIARTHAIEALSGMFEARFPSSTCSVEGEGDLLIRRCNGVLARVKMAESAQGDDEVVIQTLGK